MQRRFSLKQVFLFSLLLVGCALIFATNISGPLFGVEMTRFDSVVSQLIGILISIAASWFFSKSNSPNEQLLEHIWATLYGTKRVGLIRAEPSLLLGTKTEVAIEKANSKIYFLGIGARKFVSKILTEDTNIGRKIASGQVSMRLLLLDPDGKQIECWTRDKAKIDKIKSDIRQTISSLENANYNNNIQLKVYDFCPPLRILVIDDSEVYISRYDPTSANGWDEPQLYFSRRDAEAPLTTSYIDIFNMIWNDKSNTRKPKSGKNAIS